MVQFNTIEIIKLHMVIGDNPSCKDGPPIQASWDAFERIHMDLDEFESIRTITRHSHCPILSSQERVRVLRQSGFQYDEIEMASTTRRTSFKKEKQQKPTRTKDRRYRRGIENSVQASQLLLHQTRQLLCTTNPVSEMRLKNIFIHMDQHNGTLFISILTFSQITLEQYIHSEFRYFFL